MTPNIDPVCGMVMGPRNAPAEDNTELRDMARRFWVSAELALPVFLLATMADLFPSAIPDALAPVLLPLYYGHSDCVWMRMCFEYSLVKARYSTAVTIW